MAKKSLLPPHGVRAMAPVFAVQGGAGRSTLIGLLAQVMAPSTRTVVIDTSARSASPWPDWIGTGLKSPEKPGFPGLVTLGRAPDRAAIDEARVRRVVPVRRNDALTAVEPGEEPGYDVLADTRPWTRPPTEPPHDPSWFAPLLVNGGWSAGFIDYSLPVAGAHIEARNASRRSILDLWFGRRDVVPLLVASSSAAGPSRLQRLISLLDTDGLDARRAAVAIVDVTGADRPKWLEGEIETLGRRVGLVVQVPFDKTIHRDELTRLDGIAPATLNAARDLAGFVSSSVQHNPDDSVEAPDLGGMTTYRAEVMAERRDIKDHDDQYSKPKQSHPGQRSGGWVPDR